MPDIMLYLSFFTRQPDAILTFVVCAVVGIALLIRFVRPCVGNKWLAPVLAGLSIALITALTWVPDGGFAVLARAPWDPTRVGLELADTIPGPGSMGSPTDIVLNIVLYIPAGATITACWCRRWPHVWAWSTLTLLSIVTEILQAWSGTRAGSVQDILSNSFGAALGAATLMLFRQVLLHIAPAREESRRTLDSNVRD